jgi:hypothetical protein
LDLSGGLVLSSDVHDTIGVDVECYFNLGMTSWCHWNALKLKIAKLLVVFSEFTFSLEHSDADLGLVVSGS